MVSVNALMAEYAAELEDGGVPDALARPMPLYAVWDDLRRLAGEPEPAALAAYLDAPAAVPAAGEVAARLGRWCEVRR